MSMFRRSSPLDNKKVEEENRVIAELKDTIRDLELDIFDLRKANSDLIVENTQLKAWNTTADNQTSDWFGKSNPSLTSLVSNESNQTQLRINVEESETEDGGGEQMHRERLSSQATVRRPHSQLIPALQDPTQLLPVSEEGAVRLHRQNTIIFTNDSDFENFKISKLDIQMKCQVGKGSFGVVWKGLYRDGPVAVKLFLSAEIDIRSEVYAMSKVVGLEHVMDLIGVVEEPGDAFKPPQVALVMPFMSNGSLQDVCYRNSPTFMSRLTNETKIKFCHQAAKGVLQLHKTGIIHRDLACRNLLVDDKMDVFVADFGFARLKRIAESKGFTLTGLGPVRWEAPESLQQKEFSEKTDAFSYGVCVYEIVMGLLPWEHLASTAMVAVNVINGMRMIVPINCDPVLADVMSACWSPEPGDRPDFASIARTLGERHQQVLAEEKEEDRRIGTIEFMIRGEDVNKLPHQVHKKIITKKPQQRFLRLTSDLEHVLWRSSAANSVFSAATRSRAAERGVPLRDVLEVLAGQQTDTFRMQQMEMPAACSFSLVTAERSVDIVCGSSHHRDQWVAGLRQLLTRAKASMADMELTRRLTWSLGERIGLDSFGLLRKVAYRLQSGDMLLKFTSRKVHARHVFLTSDLLHLVWSVKEGAGPVRKGRSKSLLLSEVDSIVVGVQPARFHSNPGKHVSATASRLSEKLILRATDFSSPLAPQTKKATTSLVVGPQSRARKQQGDDELSHSQSKVNEQSPSLSVATSSLLSRIFKDKDDKEKRKKPDAGVDRSSDRVDSASISVDNSLRQVRVNAGGKRGSDRSSEVSSLDDQRHHRHSLEHEGGDDETDSVLSEGGAAHGSEQLDHDHQLTVSYLAADGRTLLSLQCPNKDSLTLWSDGVDALLQGAGVLRRMSQAHQVPCYSHPHELLADSLGAPPREKSASFAQPPGLFALPSAASSSPVAKWARAEDSSIPPTGSSSSTNSKTAVHASMQRLTSDSDHMPSPVNIKHSPLSQSHAEATFPSGRSQSGTLALEEFGGSEQKMGVGAEQRTTSSSSNGSSGRRLGLEEAPRSIEQRESWRIRHMILEAQASTLPVPLPSPSGAAGLSPAPKNLPPVLKESAYELGDVLIGPTATGIATAASYPPPPSQDLSLYSLGDSMTTRSPSASTPTSSSKVSRPLSVMAAAVADRSEVLNRSNGDSSDSSYSSDSSDTDAEGECEDVAVAQPQLQKQEASPRLSRSSSLYEVMPDPNIATPST